MISLSYGIAAVQMLYPTKVVKLVVGSNHGWDTDYSDGSFHGVPQTSQASGEIICLLGHA
jgi:hypothetical protein